MTKKSTQIHKKIIKKADKLKKLTVEQVRQATTPLLEKYVSEKQLAIILALSNRTESEEKVMSKFGIHRDTLIRWKKESEFSELLSRAEHKVYEDVTRFGYGNKENRIRLLIRQLNRLEKFMDELGIPSKDLLGETRAFSKSIAEELGQLEAQLHLSGDISYHSFIDHGEEVSPGGETTKDAPE